MASDQGVVRRIFSRPSRWPVRWRLAGVSASLTLVILVVFALIVGRLATDRIRDDFNSELQNTADSIANQVQQCPEGATRCQILPDGMAPNPDSFVRVVSASGRPISRPDDAPNVGPPLAKITDVGPYSVASQQVLSQSPALGTLAFVQYIRPHAAVDETVNRLWLFLGFGVFFATLLATLAGLAVAGRAMRPISNLTAVARDIARTRDPSQRVPLQDSDDEVAELASTLDEMLVGLEAARSETQQMVQRQREFVADASHELRTPLTSILANLELLQERLGDEPEHGEDVEMVDSALRSSRRMRRLVSDLLLLARADAGHKATLGPCELTEIAAAAVAELSPLARGQHLELNVDGPVPVQGNDDELHRLAVNLIDNGIRHTPSGTTIAVTVAERGGKAILEVADDGPGLPGSGEDLFSRFVRGSGSADRVSESGSGLGLAIVRAVVNGHGGEVEAGRSTAGGARFTVSLPLVKRPAPSLRKVSGPF
ncbi:HAMP domain-containing sensor histidine kinase [soil metagenome]